MEAGSGHHTSEERYIHEDGNPDDKGWSGAEDREHDIEGDFWKEISIRLRFVIKTSYFVHF